MSSHDQPALTELVNVNDNIMGLKEGLTIVEYGDYACPHCGYLFEIMHGLMMEYGGKIRFVFRHFPLNTIHREARQAAAAAEAAADQGKFWEMHSKLYQSRNHSLDNLYRMAEELDLDLSKFKEDIDSERVQNRIDKDIEEGLKSGVNGTPTIFIDGRRYDGAWDRESLIEAIREPPRVKLELATKRFTDLAVSGGILLFAFTILALIWANSPFQDVYLAIFDSYLDITVSDFELIHKSVEHFINDGLMAVFFLLVGLEIKRELIAGELSERSKATLPIIAALGGAVIPAGLYALINIGDPVGINGYGIAMATDIAFLLVILTLIDNRIPNSLRIFFSALAIVDDIMAILVISIFYTEQVAFNYLIAGGIMLAILILMNRGRIYQKLPYGVFGILMWWFVLQSGVHATIAGVLLALTIPTRPAPNTKALVAQCSNLMSGYSLPERADEEVRHAAVQTLESITQRIQSPLESLEHDIQPWTTYLILPIFALANAGIVLSGVSVDSLTSTITLGIIFGLVLGKPLGIVGFSWIAIRMGWAELPSRVSWKSFISVSFLAGIGFTMSLFISNLAFADPQVIDEAKIGILIASALATIIGLGLGFAFNEPIGSRKSS